MKYHRYRKATTISVYIKTFTISDTYNTHMVKQYVITILGNAGKGSACMAEIKRNFLFDRDHPLYWWTVIYNLDVSSYRMLWFITSFFRGTLNKITFNKQGCHLPQCYGPQTISDAAELVLCSHQCIKLALTAGWPLAQHDGQGYQEGRGWQDSILSRLHHNYLPVKPVGSTCHCH